MCLSPVTIINPTFVERCHEFRSLCLGDRFEFSPFTTRLNFDRDYFNKNIKFINDDNIENYYAVSNIGECIPIYLRVDCCRCVECKERKRVELFNRMLCEQIGHESMPLFFTLTYNNESLPSSGSVCSDDVKHFFNRFYTYLKRHGVVETPRHIVFSEYCPSTGRPHYHGLIFGLDVHKYWKRFCIAWKGHKVDPKTCFVDWFATTWDKGYVYIKHFQPHGFGYVSKYISKGSNVPDGCLPNFWNGSRQGGGIGTPALNNSDFVKACFKNNFRFQFNIMGELIHLTCPKFLRDKLCPKFEKYLPYDCKRKIKRLVDLILQARLLRLHYNDYVFPDYCLYVPQFIKDKFPFFDYLFSRLDLHESYLKYDRIAIQTTLDLSYELCLSRIQNLYEYLGSLDFDYEKAVRADVARYFALEKFRDSALEYLQTLPPPNDREVQILCKLNKLKIANHVA